MNAIVRTWRFTPPEGIVRSLRRAASRSLAVAAMLLAFATIFTATVALRLHALASAHEEVRHLLRRIGEALAGPF